MINNNSFYNFKKIVIEPKRKYVYLTFDNDKIIKAKKNRFTLEMSFDYACKCNPPVYDKIRGLCKKCNRVIC